MLCQVVVSKKGYSLPTLPKSSTGYVGLKNLGCICYMNATVQNFFMVPEFRRGVLEYADREDDKAESLMYQLQRMFAFLQETDKQCYTPKGFCHAFKVCVCCEPVDCRGSFVCAHLACVFAHLCACV